MSEQPVTNGPTRNSASNRPRPTPYPRPRFKTKLAAAILLVVISLGRIGLPWIIEMILTIALLAYMYKTVTVRDFNFMRWAQGLELKKLQEIKSLLMPDPSTQVSEPTSRRHRGNENKISARDLITREQARLKDKK